MAFMHEFESLQKGSRKRPGRRFFFFVRRGVPGFLSLFTFSCFFYFFLSLALARGTAHHTSPKRESALSALPGAPPAIKIHAPYGGQATSYRHERLRRTDTASGPHHHQIRSVPHLLRHAHADFPEGFCQSFGDHIVAADNRFRQCIVARTILSKFSG